MMKIDIFEDIVLRPLEYSDGVDIFNAIDAQREYLGRWLPFVSDTTSVDVSQGFVDYTLGQSEPTFTIRKGDEFAGLIGFKDTDRINLRTEIGYWLCESFQGQGIMTSSVRRLCECAFEELGLNRVQIKCAVGNHPSSAVAKRLGFSLEGVERAGELFPDGTFADIEVYAILKSEFQTK